jgi:hypothetical protein
MNVFLDTVVRAIVMGIAGAALMDAWGLALRRAFGIPTLDDALLGRWIGHMSRGRFVHQRIAAADPVPGERPLGYLVHHGIGAAFALPLLLVAGPAWADAPTPWPALAVGLGTIVAPWLVMQPGMGAGLAGSRMPNPRATRLRNLATHAVYGLGLFIAAGVLALVRA